MFVYIYINKYTYLYYFILFYINIKKIKNYILIKREKLLSGIILYSIIL